MENTIIRAGESIEYLENGARFFALILEATQPDINVLRMDEVGTVDALQNSFLVKLHGMRKLRLLSTTKTIKAESISRCRGSWLLFQKLQ